MSSSSKQSQSERAGLAFPVGRVNRYLKKGHYMKRQSARTSVYLTAVLEYLVAEILDLAAQAAQQNNRGRISERHIMMAIRSDDELNNFLQRTIVASSGVLPNIHPALLPKKC